MLLDFDVRRAERALVRGGRIRAWAHRLGLRLATLLPITAIAFAAALPHTPPRVLRTAKLHVTLPGARLIPVQTEAARR